MKCRKCGKNLGQLDTVFEVEVDPAKYGYDFIACEECIQKIMPNGDLDE